MTATDTVRVDLGERSYDIRVGAGVLADAGRAVAGTLAGRALIVVTDENVAPLHLPTLERSLEAAGVATRGPAIVLPAGEGTKSFAHLERLLDEILSRGIERSAALAAFGGGVIGDLVGFAAATALRGIDFVQIPTTLLAQVDSSVGGKTGINVRHGKNLVGAFHQPKLVLADTAALDTLPRRELLAGYAEVVKYGLIRLPDFFGWLEANGARVIDGDPAARAHAVVTSCRAKAGSARCATSATRSATRWRRRPDSASACCTARRWRSAWSWRSNCRRGWASARPRTPRGRAAT